MNRCYRYYKYIRTAVRRSECVTDETYIRRHNAYCTLRVKPEWIPGSPGTVTEVYPYPGYCATVTEDPGKGTGILQNLQKFRVRARKCYRTHRSSGYCGTGVQNLQKFRVGIKMLYPYPRYLWHGRTELTEVPDTGISVVQNVLKFRVRVWMCYKTYRSSL